jgi:hypothetical protein
VKEFIQKYAGWLVAGAAILYIVGSPEPSYQYDDAAYEPITEATTASYVEDTTSTSIVEEDPTAVGTTPIVLDTDAELVAEPPDYGAWYPEVVAPGPEPLQVPEAEDLRLARPDAGLAVALAEAEPPEFDDYALLSTTMAAPVAAEATTTSTAARFTSFSGACAENGSCYGDISTETGRPKTVQVQGYFRKDGTYVRGHYRSKPSY